VCAVVSVSFYLLEKIAGSIGLLYIQLEAPTDARFLCGYGLHLYH
jgi:hypothetical protein